MKKKAGTTLHPRLQLTLYIFAGGALQGGGYILMTLGRADMNVLGGFCVAMGLLVMFRGGSIANSISTQALIGELKQNNQVMQQRAQDMLAVVEELKRSSGDFEKKQKVTELESDLHEWINALIKNK